MLNLFVKVILPLPLHDIFIYRVPVQWQNLALIGRRAIVQFGAKKKYAGLIFSLVQNSPENIDVKDIIEIIDEKPLILPKNLQFWQWISEYYCCSLGDVYRAAFPPGLKLESKTKFNWVENDNKSISDYEVIICDMIKQQINTVDALQKKLGSDFSFQKLKSLIDRNIISIEEQVGVRYKPKTEAIVTLHASIKSEQFLNKLKEELSKAIRQQALLIHFVKMAKVFKPDHKPFLNKKELLKHSGISSSVLNELVRKKILSLHNRAVSHVEIKGKQVDLNLLNPFQEQAMQEINNFFLEKRVVLIHGVTASGKTEIYIHLIENVLKCGRQVLYLLPEIALTTQIIERLVNVFGTKVGIFHSRLDCRERVEVWERTLLFQSNPNKGYQIIIGARSALFIPFADLGLVIVDEEHENSFKQFDPAPRYQARDMAVILGKHYNADVILGSATPSFESYYNALSGKYGLVNLDKKHSNLEQPEVIVADIIHATNKKQMHSILTPDLYVLIKVALQKGEQIILFHNRRGYSPYVQCFTCGAIPKCKNCDVSLTFHLKRKNLNCHYCGYAVPVLMECPECGSENIKNRGLGTEKIEEELKFLFPESEIERMDFDSTRTKNSFNRIIRNLETRKTDILIGTQMVTKGFDFEHVSVVGILDTDSLFSFPDFRSHERAFQLIVQVSGRAGRRHNRGKVVVQTTRPEHPLIVNIKNQDFLHNFRMQMHERKLFKYPPYYRLIKLVVKHKNIVTVKRVAGNLASLLQKNENLIILGPEFPLVSRIHLWYCQEIWIKMNRNISPFRAKRFIMTCIENVRRLKYNSSTIINIDVDPV